MYDHIIVPFDGTKAANSAACVGADLATALGARLVVATSTEAHHGESLREMKGHAMSFSDQTVTVWLEPAHSISEAFEAMLSFRPRSLICMYSHARTGLLRSVYGNLAQTLLRVTDAPLLILGPEWSGASVTNLNHLIVCVDGSPTSEAAIPLAGAWAEALPLDVTLLHVDTHGQSGAGNFAVDLDRLAMPLESRCEIVEKAVVESRSVVQGILDVVKHSVDPIVVMGSHGRGGGRQLFERSIVADLSKRCPVPILVQRGPLPTVRFRPDDDLAEAEAEAEAEAVAVAVADEHTRVAV